MIPDIGSRWCASDGRVMVVDEVVIPTNPADMPWCKMTVTNARKGMRKKTQMNTGNFGTNLASAFLRPAPASESQTQENTWSILDFRPVHDDVVATCGAEPSLREMVFKYYSKGIDDEEKALEYARAYCIQIEQKVAKIFSVGRGDIRA